MTEGPRPTSIQELKIVWNNRSHTVLAPDDDHVFLLVLRFDITVMTRSTQFEFLLFAEIKFKEEGDQVSVLSFPLCHTPLGALDCLC